MSFICISDTHVGSIFSIRSTPFNKLQRMLLDGFNECKDRFKQPNRIEELLLGGDMCEGTNPAKPGLDLWTVHTEVQAQDAANILRPIAKKAKRTRLVRGSPFHSEPGRTLINADEMVAQLLNAEPFENSLLQEEPYIVQNSKALEGVKIKSPRMKELQNQIIPVKTTQLETKPFLWRSGMRYKNVFNNVAIVLKHHIGFSSNPAYRGTVLTKGDMLFELQKHRHFSKEYESIIHLYGHAHYYFFTGNTKHLNLVIPCWKYNDSFLEAKEDTKPDFGIVELIIESNGEYEFHCYQPKVYPVED